jgi:ABC-2 type transport system ATP-binding protein
MLHHLAILACITNKIERTQMVEALLQQTNLWNTCKKSLSTYSRGMNCAKKWPPFNL